MTAVIEAFGYRIPRQKEATHPDGLGHLTRRSVDEATSSDEPAIAQMPSISSQIALPFSVRTFAFSPANQRKGSEYSQMGSSKPRTIASTLSPITEHLEQSKGQPIAAGFGSLTSARQGAEQDEQPTRRISPVKSALKVKPKENRAFRSGKTFDDDLRTLPSIPPKEKPKFVHERVVPAPEIYSAGVEHVSALQAEPRSSISPVQSAPAPAPNSTFEALGRTGGWGNGYPPDPTGDVGPNHYVQAINTALAVYNKSGNLLAGPFNFDTFMSQGQFGNLCDTDNYGDPIVLYDTFEDRWVITDFAFQLSQQGSVVNPPGAFQCFAVSKTGDPVAGGWNFYYIQRNDGLNDYPKFGVWPDGLYMSANMFGFPANGSYLGTTVWALNKAQMYSGASTVQIVSFDIGAGDFTLMPSNARLQTGTPAPGTPNFFVSTYNYLNALTVYKFKVDWNKISLSMFTGPDLSLSATSWPNASVGTAAVPAGGTSLDTLQIRAMMQNQYSKIGDIESIWIPHTVRRENTTGFAAPRWYQVNVTGGAIAAELLQAATWDPDGSNSVYRYVPSLALDRMGNMAMGYTASSISLPPSIRYAGRLATDPVNTFSKTEQTLFAGSGSQNNTGRWGDYSHMTLDPDGCTFWYTNEYYSATGSTYRTRVGNFKYAECTPVGSGGIVSGVVTTNPGGVPIPGASVMLGSRSVSTDINGAYSFAVPAGTYPSMDASYPGRTGASAVTVVVADGSITTRNFALPIAAATACLVDTSQSDFETGVPTSVDLVASAGNVQLSRLQAIDQQTGGSLSTSGAGFNATNWYGQTFVSSVTGTLQKAELSVFCSNCSGTTPNLIISVRATNSGMPVGPDLASATVPGTSSGSSSYLTAIFDSPPTLTAGTAYALIIRPTSNPTAGTYAVTISNSDAYANGERVASSNSGSTWGTPAGSPRDLGFYTHMLSGFTVSGNLVSSLKDANPAAGMSPAWGTLSWNSATPAGTDIRFQGAAGNNAGDTFIYMGPDGTANTYFTNGASLAQFNGFRFLRYRASFTGTSSSTPSLSDVNVCFSNSAPSSCNLVSLPSDLAAAAGANTTIPVSTSSLTGQGVIAADFTFTYNPSVLDPTPANISVTAGAVLSPSAQITVNKGTPGTVIVSVFDTAEFSGSGSLVNINMRAIGSSGTTSDLSLSNFRYNGGQICVNSSAAGDVDVTDTPTTTSVTSSGSPSAYGTQVTFTATVLPVPTGGTVDFVIDGSTTCDDAPLNGSGQATCSTASLPVPGSPHVVSASYSGTTGYALSSGQLPGGQTITKADASCSISGMTIVYDGNAHRATGNCIGVGGGTLNGLNLGASFISVPGGTASWYFVDPDGNYNDQNGSVQIVISKATPTVTLAVSNTPVIYNASPRSADVGITVSSVAGTAVNVQTGGAAAQTNAGTYAVTADFIPDDSNNYETLASLTAGSFVIEKAAPNCSSITGAAVTYNGSSYGATGSCKDLTGNELSTLDLGALYTNYPGGTANWIFTSADSNYSNASGSVQITINQAVPTATLAVANSPVIYNGDARTAIVGITSSSVSGTVENVLVGGSATQTNAATYAVTAGFVPEDSNNYITLAGLPAGDFVIGKAPADCSSISGANVTFDGNAHGATGSCRDLNGNVLSTLSLGTTFTDVPGGTANWTFTSTDSNYSDSSGSVQIVIGKATPAVTLAVGNSPVTYNGSAQSASVDTITSSVPGLVTNISTGGAASQVNAGIYAVTASFVPNDTSNYDSINGLSVGNFVINKATPNCSSIIGLNVTYDGDPHGASGSCKDLAGGDLAALDLGLTFTNVPGGTANWVFTSANSNYSNAAGSVNIVISKAMPATVLSVSNSPVSYSGIAQAAVVTSTNPAGVVSNIRYDGTPNDPTNAATYAVTANFIPTDPVNYETLVDLPAGSFVISQANVIATAGSGSAAYDGAVKTPALCVVTGGYTGDLSCTNDPPTVGPAAGEYAISAVVTGTGLSNFNVNEVAGSYSILTGTVAGNISYAVVARPVPGVSMGAPGSVNVSGSTDVSGNYSLTNFGSGSYTITPSKPKQACFSNNGIFAMDASLVSQHVVGLTTLSADAHTAASVSGMETLSSFDAALIAQAVVCLNSENPINQARAWKFSPVNTTHSTVIGQAITDNYKAYLMGDVNGDWSSTGANSPETMGEPVRASVGTIEAVVGSNVDVPLMLHDLKGAGVFAYQFDLEFDPAVLTPAEASASVAGTLSESLDVVSHSPAPGLLKVAVYGAVPASGDGRYANLVFAVRGSAGQSSPLLIRNFVLNDGSRPVENTDGSFRVTAPGETGGISGRILTPYGNGVKNALVTVTNSAGLSHTVLSGTFGYFKFDGLSFGQTYTVTVRSKRYRFASATVEVTENMAALEMVGLE